MQPPGVAAKKLEGGVDVLECTQSTDSKAPKAHATLARHSCQQNRARKGGLTAANQDLVRAILIPQLGSIALPGLKLDSNLLLVEQIGALEDDAE